MIKGSSTAVQLVLSKLPCHKRVVDGGSPQSHPGLGLDLEMELDRDFYFQTNFPHNQLRDLSKALDEFCAASESPKIEYEYTPSKQLLYIHIPSVAKPEHGHIVYRYRASTTIDIGLPPL